MNRFRVKSKFRTKMTVLRYRSTKTLKSFELRISFARTSFTFSYSSSARTGSELVPSEGKVVGSMVGDESSGRERQE